MAPDDDLNSARAAILNRRLVLVVFASFIMLAAAVILRLGIGATPYETTDGAGRAMGFNDPLHAEHFGIIVRNFRPMDFLRVEHAYDWLLLAMHAAGAALLLATPRVSIRLVRWFFAVQAAIFPLGLALCWMPPLLLASAVTGSMDREGFIDLPFIPLVGQSTWVLTSLIVLFALRGPGLGIAKVWGAVRAGARSGCSTFLGALR